MALRTCHFRGRLPTMRHTCSGLLPQCVSAARGLASSGASHWTTPLCPGSKQLVLKTIRPSFGLYLGWCSPHAEGALQPRQDGQLPVQLTEAKGPGGQTSCPGHPLNLWVCLWLNNGFDNEYMCEYHSELKGSQYNRGHMLQQTVDRPHRPLHFLVSSDNLDDCQRRALSTRSRTVVSLSLTAFPLASREAPASRASTAPSKMGLAQPSWKRRATLNLWILCPQVCHGYVIVAADMTVMTVQ